MTGQGNIHHQQIKRESQQKREHRLSRIDLSATYRTAGGHRVRGLYQTHTNKKVVQGQVTTTGSYVDILKGQVYMRDVLQNDHFAWVDQAWYLNGEHLISDTLDLVASQPDPHHQLQLI